MNIRTEFDRICDNILYRRWRWQQKQRYNGNTHKVQWKTNTRVSKKRKHIQIKRSARADRRRYRGASYQY